MERLAVLKMLNVQLAVWCFKCLYGFLVTQVHWTKAVGFCKLT